MNSVKIEVLSQIQNMFTGGPFSNRGSGKVGSVPSRSLAQGRCGWIPPSYSTWLRNLHGYGIYISKVTWLGHISLFHPPPSFWRRPRRLKLWVQGLTNKKQDLKKYGYFRAIRRNKRNDNSKMITKKRRWYQEARIHPKALRERLRLESRGSDSQLRWECVLVWKNDGLNELWWSELKELK